MNPLRVALDARLVGRDFTGDSTYWTGLVRGLAELDSPIEFLLFSNGPAPAEIPKTRKLTWISLKSRNTRWWSLVTFPLAARKMGASAIHTQYNLSPLAGPRGITTIHDVSFFIGPQWFRPRDRFLLQRFVPRSARRAKRIVTVSQTSAREIERYIPAAKGKVEVAMLGPNPDLSPTTRGEARGFVAARGFHEPFALTVGTRWPRKNMQLAIEAMELLSPELPHRLIVTGKKGWDEGSAGSRTLYAGYVPTDLLSALYCAADLYLAPSFHEGFGLPLLEAFACGCPAVCSQGGALPEVSGGAAHIVESWEPKDWAAVIEDLLSDSSKLESMRERGKARAAEFSWKACAEVHERVYREVSG